MAVRRGSQHARAAAELRGPIGAIPGGELRVGRQRGEVVQGVSEAPLERHADALGEAARVALDPLEVNEHAAVEVDLDVGAGELVRVGGGDRPVGDDGGEVADVAVARLIVLEVGQEDKGTPPPRLLKRALHQDAVSRLEEVEAHRRLQVRVLVVEEDRAHERLRVVERVGFGAHCAFPSFAFNSVMNIVRDQGFR